MGSPPSAGLKKPEVEHALEAGEQERDRDDRRAEDEDNAGRVVRPDKERQAEPGHARRAHRVDRDDEVEAGENRREPVDEDADDGRRDRGVGINAAERRVERPAGVETAGRERIENEAAADEVDVPAQKIDLREGKVLRANHQRNKEVAEDRRNRRNQEEENHRHAVHGEQLVVGFRRDQVAVWRKQVDADHRGERAADEEEERDRRQIQQRDALMVGGQQPRTNAIRGVEIVLARQLMPARARWCSTHSYFFPAGAIPAPVAGTGCDCNDLI